MSQREILLILDDDPTVTEGLALALEREGRTVITCNDREAAEIALSRLPISLLLTDVRLTGPFAFEGLDLVRDLAGRISGNRIVLMTGESDDALRTEAKRRGAAGVLEKPFAISALEQLLESQPLATILHESTLPTIVRIPDLDEVMKADNLWPAFQPVIVLGKPGREMFAFESLARYRGSSALFDTPYLFEYAEKRKRLTDLDLSCIDRSFRDGRELAKRGKLLINIHPHVLEGGESLPHGMIASSRKWDLPLGRVVVEITEQASITQPDAAIECIDELRGLGVEFALDDVGIAFSHLSLIDRIRPVFLKISQEFGTGFERDETKKKIVRNIAALARDFGCETIIEGIEEASTAVAAAELGIRLGQGYYFARPAPAEQFLLSA